MPDDSKSHQNYELLIRIDEQLKNFTREVRESNIGFDRRIAILDTNKLGKDEAMRMQVESDKIHTDHESRLRSVEDKITKTQTQIKTWGTAIAIALSLLQIILKFI